MNGLLSAFGLVKSKQTISETIAVWILTLVGSWFTVWLLLRSAQHSIGL